MRRWMKWFSVGVVFLTFGAGAAFPEAQALKAAKKKEQIAYGAINPRGIPEPVKILALSTRIPDLNGKTVYVVNCGKTYAEEILAAIAKLLPEYIPRVKVIHTGKKKFYGEDEPELWKEIKEKADAVVIGPKD